jgi:hypothetical protein
VRRGPALFGLGLTFPHFGGAYQSEAVMLHIVLTCPTNYVRDQLSIGREQCAKLVSRKSRWSSIIREADREPVSVVGYMAQAFRWLSAERHQAPEAARGRECAAEEVGC